MTTTTSRCVNCGCGIDTDGATCVACGQPGASVGALASRRYEAGPMPTGSYDIELGPSASLSWTFRLWSENIARLAVLGVIPYLLMLPIAGIGVIAAFSSALPIEPLGEYWGAIAAFSTAAGVLFLAFALASTAAVIHLVDEKTQGVDVTAWAALLASLRHVGWLFCAWLVLGCLVTLGVAAPLVPLVIGMDESDWGIASLAIPALIPTAIAFVLVARLTPLLPVIIVEDTNVVAALSRAWALTSGRTTKVALSALLFMLAYMGVSMVVGMIGIIPILGPLLQIGVNALLLPLAYVFPFVIYAGCVREEAQLTH